MENQRNDLLFTVKKWQRTEKKTGVILHASAYDKERKEWHNIRMYVPFAVNVAEAKREESAIAKFAKDDAAGVRGCWLHIPVEFVPKPKEEAKPKTSETLEDGDIPF